VLSLRANNIVTILKLRMIVATIGVIKNFEIKLYVDKIIY